MKHQVLGISDPKSAVHKIIEKALSSSVQVKYSAYGRGTKERSPKLQFTSTLFFDLLTGTVRFFFKIFIIYIFNFDDYFKYISFSVDRCYENKDYS